MSKPILFKSDEIVPLLRRGMPIWQIASSLKVNPDLIKACQSLYCKELVNSINAAMYKSIVRLRVKTNLSIQDFQRTYHLKSLVFFSTLIFIYGLPEISDSNDLDEVEVFEYLPLTISLNSAKLTRQEAAEIMKNIEERGRGPKGTAQNAAPTLQDKN